MKKNKWKYTKIVNLRHFCKLVFRHNFKVPFLAKFKGFKTQKQTFL